MHKFHIVVVDHTLRFIRAVDLYGIDDHDVANHLVLIISPIRVWRF